MGRIGAKGKKKVSVTNQDDRVINEKVKVPSQKRRGLLQKSLKDEIDDEDLEAPKMEDEDTNGVPSKDVKIRNGKKRKQNARVKEKVDSVEGESGNATKSSIEESEISNGLRQNRNRRKNKPRRAPEAVVECN